MAGSGFLDVKDEYYGDMTENDLEQREESSGERLLHIFLTMQLKFVSINMDVHPSVKVEFCLHYPKT
jgi:hypothetical protein